MNDFVPRRADAFATLFELQKLLRNISVLYLDDAASELALIET